MDNTTPAFPETADIETSSDDYATRFAGPTGAWMLEVQERITLALLNDILTPGAGAATTVLDVGGGHGQLAIPLCRDGYRVTVLGSAESCRHRIRAIADSGQCEFRVGNVIELPFPDRSFDAVISFRMLTHCAAWPRLVSELCRVTRGPVIVDYPTRQSLNAIAPLLFEAKKKIEVNTRTWTLFNHSDVRSEFERNGFRIDKRRSQFFLPMVLHRTLKSSGLSAIAEQIARMFGLTALLGSPVILRAMPERNRQGDTTP